MDLQLIYYGLQTSIEYGLILPAMLCIVVTALPLTTFTRFVGPWKAHWPRH